MAWELFMPTRVLFGQGTAARLPELLEEYGIRKPALVCGKSALGTKTARQFTRVFSGIRANPTAQNVRDFAAFLLEAEADGVVALGGGSVLDCAKAAAGEVRKKRLNNSQGAGNVPLGESIFAGAKLPLFALPTTAGTGSEVTSIAVISDGNTKQPHAAPEFYPAVALVDPAFTVSCPPNVTAESGIDALSHALEALWSINHRPPCDELALHATRLILHNLEAAYNEPENLSARGAMSEGSLLAGLAFSQTKTAGVHACSFPLTVRYGLSHGAACGFTLAAFTRVNATAENHRLDTLSQSLGFAGAFALADEIDRLKSALALPLTLAQAGIPDDELPQLARESLHPNIKNNPVPMDEGAVLALLESLRQR
ncbi:MAG: iron-containing alcohol dehydrogenase [Oscillospiraceae bacterium]|jgi:alcohol dehydrogenase|nr:iron-containing alcohol dehydrogenase [Oscillospiraceae bacterium]